MHGFSAQSEIINNFGNSQPFLKILIENERWEHSLNFHVEGYHPNSFLVENRRSKVGMAGNRGENMVKKKNPTRMFFEHILTYLECPKKKRKL
jgi:hypothetical protein